MNFKVTVDEMARHRTTYLVDAKTNELAMRKAVLKKGEKLSDEVNEWQNDGVVVRCVPVPVGSKSYKVVEDGPSVDIVWTDGHYERCFRTEYPMHHKLVENLLLEAGYSKVKSL